ncbi:hepatocyte nuclear factor 3-beta [Trichonephila inaurata madagascariensis]|uniref:Hepatocyte nuclear factor 3-beta n=1 Tax=Trichonephila inaurata madagascariensis TaxID=2747483 RepID=A0A8X6YVW1_9ARAC|nr:hepatocyte nuclear factor 3-beta [Trichonephila inaurata madagascariensis]
MMSASAIGSMGPTAGIGMGITAGTCMSSTTMAMTSLGDRDSMNSLNQSMNGMISPTCKGFMTGLGGMNAPLVAATGRDFGGHVGSVNGGSTRAATAAFQRAKADKTYRRSYSYA